MRLVSALLAALFFTHAALPARIHAEEMKERRLERMTKTLDLTSDQQAAVKAALEDQRVKMKALHEETEIKITSVLNDDQKKKYADLKDKAKDRREDFKERRKEKHQHKK